MPEEHVYFGDFASKDDIASSFETELSDDIHILFAHFNDTYGYDGQAFVLYEQQGKLYEVTGDSCSYDGLSSQWKPEEVNLQELAQRLRRPLELWERDYMTQDERQTVIDIVDALCATGSNSEK